MTEVQKLREHFHRDKYSCVAVGKRTYPLSDRGKEVREHSQTEDVPTKSENNQHLEISLYNQHHNQKNF